MLLPGQKDYLSKLPPERAMAKVSIKSWDSRIPSVAESVVKKIKNKIPEADVKFMGASALGISGQNDIDIYVLCSDKEKDAYTEKLKELFGEKTKEKKWKFFEGGFEVSVYINNPEDQKQKEQIEIFEIFKNNPKILKEYEELKLSMNGKTYKEYQTVKYEFYNRVLGLVKTLKFRPNLVNEIIEGRKATTWRLFDDKDLQAGDKLGFLNSETLEKFAEAEITEIKEKKLGEIEDADYEGHERYASQEEMLKHYRNYYGNKVNLDSVVKIIKFRIL